MYIMHNIIQYDKFQPAQQLIITVSHYTYLGNYTVIFLLTLMLVAIDDSDKSIMYIASKEVTDKHSTLMILKFEVGFGNLIDQQYNV